MQLAKFEFVNVVLMKLKMQFFESLDTTSNWKMTVVSQVLYFKRWTICGHVVGQSVGQTAYLQKSYLTCQYQQPLWLSFGGAYYRMKIERKCDYDH